MYRILLPALVLLIVGGAGVEVASGQAPASSGPVAEAPTYKEGDEWRFTGGSWRKVIGFEGEHVITTQPSRSCRECRWYRDKNLKEWSFSQRAREGGTGLMRDYDNFLKVEAYEEVKTKAGTFKAFRVLYRQENRGPYPWSGRATFWYAPEAKWFVKWEVHTSGWGEGWELESSTLK